MKIESISTILLSIFLHTALSVCSFENDKAYCEDVDLGDEKGTVTVTVNDCVVPVDATFQIKTSNWTWVHTFVNVDEIQRISHRLSIHVRLSVGLTKALVMANFITSGSVFPVFIDDAVNFNHEKSCSTLVLTSVVPLAVFIVLCVLTAGAGVMCLQWRHQQTDSCCWLTRSRRRTGELLEEMEPPSLAWPHGTATYTPLSLSTTVIKNKVYRDSIILEEHCSSGENNQESQKRDCPDTDCPDADVRESLMPGGNG